MPKPLVFPQASPQPVVLHVSGLCFAHGQVPLLHDVAAAIPAGVSLLTGDEGRGKTTLLRLLARDLVPQAGSCVLVPERASADGGALDATRDPDAWRAAVFYADAREPKWDEWDVDAVLGHLRARHGATWNATLLQDLIEAFALTEHRAKRLFMLSTGSRRKVMLAAAFASGAALTLLDDPWAALDSPSRALLTELLAEAAEHPTRAWLVSGYDAPPGVPLATRWTL